MSYAFSRPVEHLAVPLVDGNRLMKNLGLAPGPVVGTILRELSEAQASGTIATVEEALTLAEELLAGRR